MVDGMLQATVYAAKRLSEVLYQVGCFFSILARSKGAKRRGRIKDSIA
jgi:hypothetical protein